MESIIRSDKGKQALLSRGFFIVGAPKCGTTALHVYLNKHPSIFMPWIKEPHYFASDLEKSRVRPIDDPTEYFALFDAAANEHLVVGEASVFYLSSAVALANIKEFNADAKIIVMVRNPIDMFASLHSQLYFTLDEDQKDIQIAWDLQERRAAGLDLPRTTRIPKILQYLKTCSLGAQLQSLLSLFDRSQVHIIVFDNFVKDTRGEYEKLVSFLGLPNDNRTVFERVNENKAIRHRWLAHLYHDRSYLKSFWQGIERTRARFNIPYDSFIRRLYLYMHGLYMESNSLSLDRDPLSPQFRKKLSLTFKADVALLSRLLNEDLSYWLSDDARID